MQNIISIITPSYNSNKFIKNAIDSVLSQTNKSWEMIIVDDASNDGSVETIRQLIKDDNRFKLVVLDKNIGAAMARNRALEEAHGRYLAFLDCDDIWMPDKLEKQLKFMQENSYPISFTSYETIDEAGNLNNHVINSVDSLTLDEYLKNTIIGFSTSMIDTDLVKDKISFLDIRIRQDANLWITLLKRGYKAYGLKEVLVKYRVHQNSISANKLKAAKQVWKLYYNIHKFGLFKAIYYFAFYAFNTIKKRIKV